MEDQIYWLGRELTQSERKLEFEARKKQRERHNVSGAHVTWSSTSNTSARSATIESVIHNDIVTPNNNK